MSFTGVAYTASKHALGGLSVSLAQTRDSYRPASQPQDITRAILALVNLEAPPLRLAVGPDAIEGIRRARSRQLDELEAHQIPDSPGVTSAARRPDESWRSSTSPADHRVDAERAPSVRPHCPQ